MLPSFARPGLSAPYGLTRHLAAATRLWLRWSRSRLLSRLYLVNGALAARNCFGNAQISVAQGGLDLFYERWQSKKFSVDAKIISGNARAFLPGQASFHMQAEALNGHVANRLADAGEAKPSRATKVSLFVGAEDSSDIIIRATNGNIDIAPAKVE